MSRSKKHYQDTEFNTICAVHREILSLVKDDLYGGIGKIKDPETLERIEELTCIAFDTAQSMENRLKQYRKAIEKLGFVKQ